MAPFFQCLWQKCCISEGKTPLHKFSRGTLPELTAGDHSIPFIVGEGQFYTVIQTGNNYVVIVPCNGIFYRNVYGIVYYGNIAFITIIILICLYTIYIFPEGTFTFLWWRLRRQCFRVIWYNIKMTYLFLNVISTMRDSFIICWIGIYLLSLREYFNTI